MTSRPSSSRIPRQPRSRPSTRSHPGSQAGDVALSDVPVPSPPISEQGEDTTRNQAGAHPATEGTEISAANVERACTEHTDPLVTGLQDLESSLPQEATRINMIEDRLVAMEDRVKTGAENDN